MNHRQPIGQLALHEQLGGRLPMPAVRSYLANTRRTVMVDGHVEETYPQYLVTDGSPLGQLRFALKHEAFDMRIIIAALQAIGGDEIRRWVQREPTGGYSRTVWFLYESLVGTELDLENATRGNYVDVLDPRKHFVAPAKNSTRHRVRDNLLGTRDLCPTVRRTTRIEDMIRLNLGQEARNLVSHYSADILARAANFLFTKETRSSFAIEGETPSSGREERFTAALKSASAFDPTNKKDLVELQNKIVDRRYAASDWRDIQNFIGETSQGYREYVHYVCPRPEDIPSLMLGWMELTERLLSAPLDPILIAAVSAFAFVFVHPFEDGNGRIHRFLIHALLERLGFNPSGIIYPISASILRQMPLYDQTLEAFSKPTMQAIEWSFTPEYELVVHSDTRDLYRFFDATPQVEYLYDRVADTVRVDFKDELDFLSSFDRALAAIRQVIDMPDRRASLLARLLLQNRGTLSSNKRDQFSELRDDELHAIEAEITDILHDHRTP